jgi:serine phosphatase RsbU (regulator of sigma subunit)
MEDIKIKYYGLKITKKQFFLIYAFYTIILLTGLVYFTISPLNPDKLHFLKGSIAYILLTNASIYFIVFLTYTIIEGQFFWNRFTKKQLQLIRNLTSELEEKNKNITDSIRYSKHIQNAILPSQKLIRMIFQNSFVLYKPKDIVAGDFYWMESIKELVFTAVADCTGHGVPGAILSFICNNAINTAIREYHHRHPAEILDKTRELLQLEFEKSEDQINDGMDISLCVFNPSINLLEWAGANSPLWIVRSGTKDIEEIRPDKQPIGRIDNPKPFTNHSIQVTKNDSIYIFSDGYRDQFGGDNGKKLMTKGFKDHILSIQELDMNNQGEYLNKKFVDWKRAYDQNDDVCVMGIRF